MKTTLTCQVKECGKEYHDITEYYAHTASHEMKEKLEEK